MSEEKAKVDVNVVQVVASALAAVSSAVLLSTVGVAGTVIGAAAGSVIATVGSAVYSYSLRVSRERVAAAAALAASARLRRPDGGTHHLSTRELTEQAADEAAAGDPKPSWRESLAHVDKKRVALAAAAVFVAAMVAIVGFELVAGRPVSYYTGGTSSSDTTGTSIGVGHRRGASTPTQAPATGKPSPTPTTTPSGVPATTGGTSPSPSVSSSPTALPSSTPTAGTTPATTPTEAPTPAG